MPPPYFTKQENKFGLPVPRFMYPLAKVGLAVYASIFIIWLIIIITK